MHCNASETEVVGICKSCCDFNCVVHMQEVLVFRWDVCYTYGGGFDKWCEKIVQLSYVMVNVIGLCSVVVWVRRLRMRALSIWWRIFGRGF